MSQIRITPAEKEILRVLRSGETLTNKDIRARSGKDVKRAFRERLVAAGHLSVDKAGNAFTYTLTDKGQTDLCEKPAAPFDAADKPPDRLSAKERIALFALLSPSLRVSYTEVRRIFGLTISVTVRTALRDNGLVVVPPGQEISFELTDKGWQAAEAELSRPGEAEDPALLRLLHHHYAQILGTLRTRGLSLADMYTDNHADSAKAEPVVSKAQTRYCTSSVTPNIPTQRNENERVTRLGTDKVVELAGERS